MEENSMKNFLKMFIVLAAMSFTQLAVAREALLEATIKDIKVTSIAPAVQEQLNKASPEERKSLEAAIHTGNLFIPQYFSYNAYDTTSENQDWVDEVEPLISLDMEQWAQQYGKSGIRSKNVKLGKDDVYTYRLTCPQVSLISVQQNDQITSLLYRATSVGMLMYFQLHSLYDFNLEAAGEIYDVRLDLGKSSALVNEVFPIDKWKTWSYTREIAFMERFLGDHRTAHTTKKHAEELVISYQGTIQKIEKSAAKYCK
jgi:hypothetical protein